MNKALVAKVQAMPFEELVPHMAAILQGGSDPDKVWSVRVRDTNVYSQGPTASIAMRLAYYNHLLAQEQATGQLNLI